VTYAGQMTENKKKKKKKKKKKRGGRTFLLCVLLGILGFVGHRNYQRNLEAEAAVPRPYKSHSEADLNQLITAYEADLTALVARYEKATGTTIRAQDRGFVGDQIKEFERVQRLSRSVRTLGYEISEREATLRELKREKQSRMEQGTAVKQFLRRLFTYSI